MGRDTDRGKGWGNLRRSMDSYNLYKDTDTGNWKGSCRDTDMGTDKGNSNPLDRDKCKSLHTGYNSTACYTAPDTGMDKDIHNPERRCRRYTAS
ncbi:MAG: hypothetical protein QUS09_09350 [Methanotrichaceae archaeon]|nr:hypothetical protein [Methanotrichaceae archaeon]